MRVYVGLNDYMQHLYATEYNEDLNVQLGYFSNQNLVSLFITDLFQSDINDSTSYYSTPSKIDSPKVKASSFILMSSLETGIKGFSNKFLSLYQTNLLCVQKCLVCFPSSYIQ